MSMCTTPRCRRLVRPQWPVSPEAGLRSSLGPANALRLAPLLQAFCGLIWHGWLCQSQRESSVSRLFR